MFQNTRKINKCLLCKSKKIERKFKRGDGLYVYKCDNCNIGFVNQRPFEKEVLQYYENSMFIRDINREFQESRKLKYEKTHLRRILKTKKNIHTVLDIGCGSGFFLYEAKKYGMKETGIDLSNQKVDYAKQILGLNVKKCVIDEIEQNGSFDLITCIDVIEHVANPLSFFNTVAECLKEDGIIYLVTPNFDAAKKYGDRWNGFHIDYEHLQYFNEKSLRYLADQCNLEIGEIYYLPRRQGLMAKQIKCYPHFGETGTMRRSGLIRNCVTEIPLIRDIAWTLIRNIRYLVTYTDIKKRTAFEICIIFKK
jgi:2-polyprenyl-3-methyl-5-hydroxy-6-metoxy-1,4-benzoquinol methylase